MKTQINILNEIYLAEEEIRAAQSKQANSRIRQLILQVCKLESEHKIKVGNILRRTGDYALCLKLLHSLVREENSDSELLHKAQIEYAGALTQLGLTIEAQELLTPILDQFPQALLIISLSHFQNWEHQEALPYLEKLMQSTTMTSYESAVTQINFYMACSLARISDLNLNDLIQFKSELEKMKAHLLLGVLDQIIGRYWMNLREFKQAKHHFQMGMERLSQISTHEAFIIKKWDLVCDTLVHLEKPSVAPEPLLQRWDQLKMEAINTNNYETTRECDYFKGLYFQKKHLLDFCYHGTPYSGYLSRFQNPKEEITITMSFDKKVKPSSALSKKRLDDEIFPSPGSQHKLLQNAFMSLMNDFYKPQTVPRMYQYIYPHQYWNPQTSPIQVRQALFRLRKYLNEKKSEILIVEQKGQYQLCSTKESLTYRWSSSWKKLDQQQFTYLLHHFGHRCFHFSEFGNFVGGSLRTQRRQMQELLQKGLIQKTGNTRSALYKLVPTKS